MQEMATKTWKPDRSSLSLASSAILLGRIDIAAAANNSDDDKSERDRKES